MGAQLETIDIMRWGEVTTQDAENNITTIKQDETTEQETYLT